MPLCAGGLLQLRHGGTARLVRDFCGNGTPYRFFVNRTPLNHDVAITFEGGGACWDQDACEGKGEYAAGNPDGIPPDYMKSLKFMAARGLVTPFSSRLDPLQKVRTQDWSLVYLPYCTGDVHGRSRGGRLCRH